MHAQPVDLRFELVVVDEPGHVDDGGGDVEDGGGDDDVGGHVVLVLVRAEAADLAFLAGLEDAAAGFVGLMEDEVAAGVDQRQRGQLRGADVVEVAGVDLLHFELRIDRLRAGFEGEEGRCDRRQVDAADESGLAGFRFARGDDAEEVGGLLELEDHRGDVRRDGAAGGGDEDRLRILLAGFERGVLKFEAVAEGEIESFRAVGAEAFLEFGGRLRFLMRDLGAELLVNLLQAFVGDGVPAAVVDGAGGEEADLHRRGRWSWSRAQARVSDRRAGRAEERQARQFVSWARIVLRRAARQRAPICGISSSRREGGARHG